MMPTVAELPDDVDMLKAMVLATDEQRAAMEADNRRIASEIAALKLINTTSHRSRGIARWQINIRQDFRFATSNDRRTSARDHVWLSIPTAFVHFLQLHMKSRRLLHVAI